MEGPSTPQAGAAKAALQSPKQGVHGSASRKTYPRRGRPETLTPTASPLTAEKLTSITSCEVMDVTTNLPALQQRKSSLERKRDRALITGPRPKRDTDQKTHAGLRRILSVWKERSVFDSHQISDFGQYLSDKVAETDAVKDTVYSGRKGHAPISHEGTPLWNDPEPVVKRKKPSDATDETLESTDANKDAEKPGEPPDPGVLIKALADLENTASSDAVVRERIASLPPEVSDASLLEKIQDRQAADRLSAQVEEACSLLAEYNNRLTQELEDRKQVSQMLANFTFHQRELMALAEQKLEEHRDKLHKVTHVRNELKSHLQNLPDLTLLPSVTGGLAPLPSAGDLFSHQ